MAMDSDSSKVGGSSYTKWAYLMKNYMISEGVWKYVDGTVKKPEEGIENYAELLSEWDEVNARIITWINDAVEPSIRTDLVGFSSAKEVWDYLRREFARINIARKYELENQSRAIVQSNRSIQELYSLMTGIWDQLAMMEPPELTNLDCYVKFREEQRLVQFLVTLKSEFEPLRRQILLRSPVPCVADAVNELITEEARLPMASLHRVLHDHIIWQILTWVPTKSLMRFKCASKRWRAIITNPSFARAYHGGFRGILIAEPYDWRKALRRDFYYLSLPDRQVMYLSHHLTLDHCGKKMGCTDTVNGILCVYYGNYSYLYNIATRECRQLPLSRNEANCCSYHLGFDPVSKLFKLLKICPVYVEYDDDDEFPEKQTHWVRNLECEILTLGVDSSWRSIIPAPWEIMSRTVCLNGILYWTDVEFPDNDDLYAFRLDEEKFQFIPSPKRNSCYLPQFGPDLALFSGISYPTCHMAMIYNGHGREPVVWTEHKFILPRFSRSAFRAVGLLPDGKVIVFAENMPIDNPSKFYIYDPATGNLEKHIICRSPSSSFLKQEGIFGYMSYHEENIIPLSCLTATNP